MRSLWGERLEAFFVDQSRFPRALLLGQQRQLPDGARRNLEIYGLAHLFALSGLHLGILLGALLALPAAASRLFGRGLRSGATLRIAWLFATAATAGLFIGLVGPRPSLTRAAASAVVAGAAIALNRRPWAFHSWSVALLACLFLRPADGLTLGLQLSFLATAGILVTLPHSPSEAPTWIGGWCRRLLTALRLSAAAQVATLPLTAPRFHMISWGAPVLNLFYVPWTSLVLLLALLCGLGFPLPSFLREVALPFERAGDWPTRPSLNAAVTAEAGVIVLFLGGVALVRRMSLALRGIALGTLFVLQCGAVDERGLQIDFLDVGQGDATLVQGRGGNILIDGGGWRRDGLGARILLPALLDSGVRKVDLMILSHADRDHCGGLVEIAARLRVERLWLPASEVGKDCGRELVVQVAGQGGLVVSPAPGTEFDLATGVVRVLPRSSGARTSNDRSLLVELEGQGRRAWFLGDAGVAVEAELVASTGAVALDVLKVAHHGSKTSTGGLLLESTRPRHALIGVGRSNAYGHPAAVVRRRLTTAGTRVWRTDLHGRIRLSLREGRPMLIEVATHPELGREPL
ncbi:MAG: ComEC/Rec2 family competence protein [Acidobacteriota bacterium]